MLAETPPPYLVAPTGKVSITFLLHLRFGCRVVVDGNLPPIWEAVARGGEIRAEGLVTLNQDLMRGLPSYQWLFGGEGALQ